MIIAITGTPGTGKTHLAKKIEKFGFFYISITDLVKQKKIYSSFDKDNLCYVVPEKKLNKELSFLISKIKKKYTADYKKLSKLLDFDEGQINKASKDIVIDGHLSHLLPKKYVDLVVAIKCPIDVLRKRLQKRNYSSCKIKDNIEAEIFDVCAEEAREKKHKVIYFS